MKRDHDYVTFADYEADTNELAQTAEAIISEQWRRIQQMEILVWAMVRAAGGVVAVPRDYISMGMPSDWIIDEDVVTRTVRYRIRNT